MSRRQYFISINPYYSDPVSGEIVRNPNTMKHFNEYMGQLWDNAETPMKITEGLKLIDGTYATVMNGMNGATMVRNCQTDEIEEFGNDNEDDN